MPPPPPPEAADGKDTSRDGPEGGAADAVPPPSRDDGKPSPAPRGDGGEDVDDGGGDDGEEDKGGDHDEDGGGGGDASPGVPDPAGVWLLFAALFPTELGLIPVAVLAGVLVHAGAKLIPVTALRPLWREHRGEAVVLAATALAIVLTDMFTGVLLGIGMAVVKTARETSAVRLDVDEQDDRTTVSLSGSATFLRLPLILDTLEALPKDRPVALDLSRLRHLDHACRTALEAWSTHSGGSAQDRLPATDGAREAVLAVAAPDGEGPLARRAARPGRTPSTTAPAYRRLSRHRYTTARVPPPARRPGRPAARRPRGPSPDGCGPPRRWRGLGCGGKPAGSRT